MSDSGPPVVPGVIHGVRYWELKRVEGRDRLCAITSDESWHSAPEPTEARCLRHKHEAPARRCGCGLYALHPTLAKGTWLGVPGKARAGRADTVVGLVEAWGRVEVYRHGFRAQYARPRALFVRRYSIRTRRMRRLAAEYGVELITVASSKQLEEVCDERFPGLEPAFVEELLDTEVEDDYRDSPPRIPLAILGVPYRRWPGIRPSSIIRSAGTALLVLLYSLIWIVPLAIGVDLALEFADGRDGPAPTVGPNRHLEVREQAAIALADGGTLYVALVRNNHPRRAALGVFPQGEFLDPDGTESGGPDERFQVDFRPTLLPGQTGVVVDVIDDRALDAAGVAGFQMGFRARAFRAAPPRTPLRAAGTRLDRRRCILTTELVSARALPAVQVAIVVRNGRGRIIGAGVREAGPVRRGRSLQVLDRVDPATCREGLGPVEAYPSLRPGQLLPIQAGSGVSP